MKHCYVITISAVEDGERQEPLTVDGDFIEKTGVRLFDHAREHAMAEWNKKFGRKPSRFVVDFYAEFA